MKLATTQHVSVIPGDVREALAILERHGYKAYIVGGAVRDIILGAEPKDYDVATDAHPEEVLSIFERHGWVTVPKGVKYGVVSVIHPRTGREIEIATFRRDMYDFTNRKPMVTYAENVEEDLARRDFTFNAMAMDASGRVIDPFGGIDDLQRGIIKFVGNPYERIREDPLRILRGIRFAIRYGFRLDPETEMAIRSEWQQLQRVSNERVGDEITKMINSEHPELMPQLLYMTGVYRSDKVMPELDPMANTRHDERGHHYGETMLQHTVDVLRNISEVTKKPELRFAALLHDVAKPDTIKQEGNKVTFYGHDVLGAEKAKEILHDRWRRTNNLTNKVVYIVYNHHWPYNASSSYNTPQALAAKAVAKHGQMAPLLLLHAYADDARNQFFYAAAKKAEEMLRRPRPLLTGYDVIKLYKVKPGPIVGKLKQKLYELQLKYNINDKKELIEKACKEMGLCPPS